MRTELRRSLDQNGKINKEMKSSSNENLHGFGLFFVESR
jgi:hypothetical protein